VNFRYPTLAPRRNPTPERTGTTTILLNERAVIHGDDDDIVERKSCHPQSPNKIRRTLDADKALIDRVGDRKIVDEHHGARAVAAKIETERGPLPVDPTVAGILGVQHPSP